MTLKSIARNISDALTVWNLGRTGVMAANPKIVSDLCEKMWTNPDYPDHQDMCAYAERMVVAHLIQKTSPDGLVAKVLAELKFAASTTRMSVQGRDVVSRRLVNEAYDIIQELTLKLAAYEAEETKSDAN